VRLTTKQEYNRVTTWPHHLPVYHASSHRIPPSQTYLQYSKLQILPNPRKCAKKLYRRLHLQPNPKSIGKNESSFQVDNLLYVDDGAFLLRTLNELKIASQTIHDHFSKFGLQVHVGTNKQIKNRSNVCPPSLLLAMNQTELPPSFKLNDGKNDIHFTNKFKYLGSIITPCLTEDAKIEARIKKAKSQMEILKHFFNCKDVAQHVKYWIYITGLLNTLL